jgi:hypothetical protein
VRRHASTPWESERCLELGEEMPAWEGRGENETKKEKEKNETTEKDIIVISLSSSMKRGCFNE